MPYPPGTSAGDPRAPWNAPDRSHEHEFFELEGPMFEDGAAIFHGMCEYAEGRYGDGWSCEETQYWRCEVERIIVHREDEPDVAYLAKTERPNEEWRYVERLFEETIMDAEKTYRENGPCDSFTIVDEYPANEYGDGYVEVRVGDRTVIYEQDR